MKDFFRLACAARMKADSPDTGEIDLYGEIITDVKEQYKWSDEDKSAKDFRNAIQKVKDAGAKNLLLHINSPGGVFTESVAMRGILAGAGFENITIRIEGWCASAATVIASIPDAKVEIMEGSFYMIHNPWTIAIGNANDFEKEIETLRKMEAISQGFYHDKSAQDVEQIKTWMDEEKWFTSEEAVKYGFADEELKATTTQAAACVRPDVMRVMQDMYKAVPEGVQLSAAEDEAGAADNHDSSDIPVAGVSTVIDGHEEGTRHMEIKDISVEQLREGNPAVMQEIQQEAIKAERQRIADIDALTLSGYEEMAEKAKADGTSALDFQRQVVAAQRKKGEDFLKARAEETTPAKAVAGEAAEDQKSEEEEIKAFAKEISGFAAQTTNDQMY